MDRSPRIGPARPGKVVLGRLMVAFLVIAGVCLSALPASALSPLSELTDPTYQTNGRVHSIVPIGNTIFIAGEFTRVRPAGAAPGVGEVSRNYLAAIDATTGTVLPWNPNANQLVYAMSPSPDGTSLYIGGMFTRLGGIVRNRAAQIGAVTGAPLPWNPNVNLPVRAILATPSMVYLGGKFATVGGQPRTRLAAVTPAGVLDPSWTPTADNWVRSIAISVDGQSLYLGGDFLNISGDTTQQHLAAVSPTTAAIQPWNTHPGYPIREFAVTPTRLYVAGDGAGGHLDAYAVPSGARLWSLVTDGGVQAVALIGGTLYGGGHFDNVCVSGGTGLRPFICDQISATRHKLVAVDPLSGALDPWDPGADSSLGVFWLATFGNKLLAGGDFTEIGHSHHQQGFAEFSNASSDVTAPSAPGIPTGVSNSWTSVDLTWTAAADDVSSTITYRVFRDGIWVAQLSSSSTTDVTYTDGGLASASTHVYAVVATDAAENESVLSGTSDPITVQTAPPGIFVDDFSSGLASWTSVTRVTPDASMGNPSAPSAKIQVANLSAFASKDLGATFDTLCLSTNIDATTLGANVLMRMRTATDGPVTRVSVDSTGFLRVRSDVSGIQTNPIAALPTGGWHNLELCGTVGTAGAWDLYLDGVKVLDQWVANTGTTQIGRISIGDTTSKTWTANFDQVIVDQTPG